MPNIHDAEEIKKIIYNFFEKIDFDVLVESARIEEGIVFVKIKTEEPKILIGQNGQTLFDIQHLLGSIIRKRNDEIIRVDADINNYKEKKIEYLKETAKSAADDVALSKKEKVLPVMPAYDRRIIHLELKDRQGIKTRSEGEEPARRVVIFPAEN